MGAVWISKVTGAPLALTGLIGLLGVATIAHALTTSVRRCRRDLAILKTLGFVKDQVRAAIIAQASTLAFVAVAVGIPVGVILGRTAWLSFADRQGVVPEAALSLWTIPRSSPEPSCSPTSSRCCPAVPPRDLHPRTSGERSDPDVHDR